MFTTVEHMSRSDLEQKFKMCRAEGVERSSYCAEVSDETPVDVRKTQELLTLLAAMRSLSYSTNFNRVHLDLSRGYDEDQEQYHTSMIFDLFCFHIQLVLQQSLEYLTHMADMRV